MLFTHVRPKPKEYTHNARSTPTNPFDARSVSVVVYQHIKTCEWKQKVAEKRRKAAAAKAASAGNDFAAPTMKVRMSVYLG